MSRKGSELKFNNYSLLFLDRSLKRPQGFSSNMDEVLNMQNVVQQDPTVKEAEE